MVKLKVGLVVNTRNNNSLFGGVISTLMGHYWTHSGWIVAVDKKYVYIQEATAKQVQTNKYSREWIEEQFRNNKLKLMDFGIKKGIDFLRVQERFEGKKYDFANVFAIGLSRFCSLFNRKYDIDFRGKKLFCSEMVARGIDELTELDVLKILNLKSFENVTPQHISVLEYKRRFI
ncbi:MAG: hypothetical protein ACOC22_00690 [bacterium]